MQSALIIGNIFSSIDSIHPALFYRPIRYTVVYIALNFILQSLSNVSVKRDEVNRVIGYLQWGQGVLEVPLHPLSQLDPESRGQQRVKSHSLWCLNSMPIKALSNHSCEMAL